MELRKSHESPTVKAIYEEFLGKPLSHKSHELLHTTYTPRSRKTVKAEKAKSKPAKSESGTKVKVE